MNNKLKMLLLFTAVVLFLGTVNASMLCEETEDYDVPFSVVTFNQTEYQRACYRFSWNYTSTKADDTIDFNNYVVHVDGDVTTSDFNLGRGAKAWSVCTVEPGDTVTIFVRPYDGNVTGHYCGFDYNTTMGSGTVTQGAMYFVYMLFSAFAAVIGLMIILFLGLYVIKKFGIGKMLR